MCHATRRRRTEDRRRLFANFSETAGPPAGAARRVRQRPDEAQSPQSGSQWPTSWGDRPTWAPWWEGRYRWHMPRLTTRKRARLPERAFAYTVSRGRRRLPVHDKAHVKNALARFSQVVFETDASREQARRRL